MSKLTRFDENCTTKISITESQLMGDVQLLPKVRLPKQVNRATFNPTFHYQVNVAWKIRNEQGAFFMNSLRAVHF
jgi:hypothetical protein